MTAGGSNEDRQQQWLANKMAAPAAGPADGVGAALASDAASGALWAKRRQSQSQAMGGSGQLGETSQSLMSPAAMKQAAQLRAAQQAAAT